jgi:hypothetical protein
MPDATEKETRKYEDTSKDTVDSVMHSSRFDTNALNRAIENASRDPNFINKSIQLLSRMQFPAYKNDILKYIRQNTDDLQVISLFETLNGYREFKDQYQIRKAFEINIPKKKTTNQISETTRKNPKGRTRSKTFDQSTKDSEVINESEERNDYPEVPPSAMSNFVCDKCGKPFQNQNDLYQHRRFEGS